MDGHSLIGISQEAAAKLMQATGPVVTLEVAKQAASFHGLGHILRQPSPITRSAPALDPQHQQQQQLLQQQQRQLGYSRASSSNSSIPKSVTDASQQQQWAGQPPPPVAQRGYPATYHPGMQPPLHPPQPQQQPPFNPHGRPHSLVSMQMMPPQPGMQPPTAMHDPAAREQMMRSDGHLIGMSQHDRVLPSQAYNGGMPPPHMMQPRTAVSTAELDQHGQPYPHAAQPTAYNRASSSSSNSIPKSVNEASQWNGGAATNQAGNQLRGGAYPTFPGPGHPAMQYPPQGPQAGVPFGRPMSMVSMPMMQQPPVGMQPPHEERHYQNVASVMGYQNGHAYPPMARPPPPQQRMHPTSYSHAALHTPLSERDIEQNERMAKVHEVLNRARLKHEQQQQQQAQQVPGMMRPSMQPQPRRVPANGYHPNMNGHAYPTAVARPTMPPHQRTSYHTSYPSLQTSAYEQEQRMNRMQEEFRRREVERDSHMQGPVPRPVQPTQRPNAEEWAKRSQHGYNAMSTLSQQLEETEERLRRLRFEEARRQQELHATQQQEELLLQAAKTRQVSFAKKRFYH